MKNKEIVFFSQPVWILKLYIPELQFELSELEITSFDKYNLNLLIESLHLLYKHSVHWFFIDDRVLLGRLFYVIVLG